MVCPECGGSGTYPVFSNSGFGERRDWVPHMINYAKLGDKPARACKTCHIIRCNEITQKKVYEISDLLVYMRGKCGIDKTEERSLRKILSNKNGSKRSFFRRNMEGTDLESAVSKALAMIRS